MWNYNCSSGSARSATELSASATDSHSTSEFRGEHIVPQTAPNQQPRLVLQRPQVHLNIPCHYYLDKLPLVILQLLCNYGDNILGHIRVRELLVYVRSSVSWLITAQHQSQAVWVNCRVPQSVPASDRSVISNWSSSGQWSFAFSTRVCVSQEEETLELCVIIDIREFNSILLSLWSSTYKVNSDRVNVIVIKSPLCIILNLNRCRYTRRTINSVDIN